MYIHSFITLTLTSQSFLYSSVAMITLLGDGLQAVYPEMDLVTSRLLCFCLMTPFEFFPLRQLSMASLLGIVSCASLVLVVLVDGFCKHEQPGSLWDPMVRRVENAVMI